MASAFAHAFAAISLGAASLPGAPRLRLLVVGAVCALLPDLDVLGLGLGVDYRHWLGHRGFSHSLVFAAGLALAATALLFRDPAWRPWRPRIALFLFVATASHGVLDGLTNGGLGVAFFWPFDDTRHFLPLRPVQVSPIGVRAFFGPQGLEVLASELVWIVAPWTLLVLALRGALRDRGRGRFAPDGRGRSCARMAGDDRGR